MYEQNAYQGDYEDDDLNNTFDEAIARQRTVAYDRFKPKSGYDISDAKPKKNHSLYKSVEGKLSHHFWYYLESYECLE